MYRTIMINNQQTLINQVPFEERINILKVTLKRRTNKDFSVVEINGGVLIQSLPENRVSRQVVVEETENEIKFEWQDVGKGGFTCKEDREILSKVFGKNRDYLGGVIIDNSSLESALWLLHNMDKKQVVLKDDKMTFVRDNDG